VTKPALIPIEGPEKATRGGEWETIKIPRRNLAYIPNWTRRPSLLTRPGPHSYWIAIGPQNWVRNRSGDTNQYQQDHVWDRWQKLDRRTVYILTGISLNTCWAHSENHRGRAIWIMNPRVFWSGNSRAIPAPPYNNSHTRTTDGRTKESGEIKFERLAPASVEVNGKTRLGAVHATEKPSRHGIGPDLSALVRTARAKSPEPVEYPDRETTRSRPK
jgi:hypothetical protein